MANYFGDRKYYFLIIRGDNQWFAYTNNYQEAVERKNHIEKELKENDIVIIKPKGQNDGLMSKPIDWA